MAEDEKTRCCCCRRFFCCVRPETSDERKPLLDPVKPTPSNEASTEVQNESEEAKTNDKEKRPAKAKELKFEMFQIAELDTVFNDFGRTLNPFVTNRVAMETAETSFKEAVASLTTISPKAKFSEYLQALKTELKEANIFLKIKGGVMVVVGEAGKVVEAVRLAVTAVNRILEVAKDLEVMPISVGKATEDALAETDEMDVMAILKREFKHWYDASKILRYKKAFSNNVEMLKQAPGMVKDFCKTTRHIVVEIYRAFADEDEDGPSYSDEESEESKGGGDSDDEKTEDEENDSERGAVGGKKEESKGKKGKEKQEENKTGKGNEKEKEKEQKEDFQKKLEFKVIGVQDIDQVFTDLARALNPFVATREGIQKTKEAFENSVKQISKFEGKREFKEYVKELKDQAKKGDITIYVDTADGEVKITSVKGLEPPKIYRDAVKALNNLKKAGKDALELEPDVQNGIAACIEDISHIEPKRDIKKGLKFKDLPKLVGKVMDLNENRKKVQQAPAIVKEFCQYLDGLITDVLDVLVEGKGKKDEEKENGGQDQSDEEQKEDVDNDEDEEHGDEDTKDEGQEQEKDEEKL